MKTALVFLSLELIPSSSSHQVIVVPSFSLCYSHSSLFVAYRGFAYISAVEIKGGGGWWSSLLILVFVPTASNFLLRPTEINI
jgi:hypothetical protein